MGSVHDLFNNPEFERRVREGYRGLGQSGGGDDGMWQQSVETRLAELRSDFRWTWGGMAAMFVLLGSMIIGSYLLLDTRILGIGKSIGDLTKIILSQ